MINDRTFLHVEDDRLSREALRIVLTRIMGVEHLSIFEDSTDFMNRLRALPRKPDVFLLDIHMRPLTGFELLELLRAAPDYRDAKIIALTASVMNEEVALLRESGFDGAIGKPFNINDLPHVMDRIIGGEAVWYIAQ
jgi:CheY-like chemotaxis protein